MSNPTWISRRAWLAVPILALGFLAATAYFRVLRVEYLSRVAGSPVTVDAQGRAGPWQPRLIVPGHHNESYEWLDQTLQMFRRKEWRVRMVDYEDAPAGHEVFAASPYRWWLGAVSIFYSGFAHAHLGPALEWAAIYADPLLLLLFAIGTTWFVARNFGALAGALTAAASTTLFPMGAEFLPGVPDDHGLSLILVVWSVLPLLAGMTFPDQASRRRWFLVAGIVGGAGLWVNVARGLPVLTGIGFGALVSAWVSRAEPAGERTRLPWRTWSVAGAATCLVTYLIEFFPNYMGAWELRAIHPLFGVAWLGAGELITRGAAWIQGDGKGRGLRDLPMILLSFAAAASLIAALFILHSLEFLSLDLPSMRLSLLPGGSSAPNLWSWLLQNGFTAGVSATLLPLVILIPALVVVLLPGRFGTSARMPVAVALGPVLVGVLFAIRQISWWNEVDAAALALLAVTAAGFRDLPRPRLVAGVAALAAATFVLPGAFQLWPSEELRTREGLSETEVIGLVERDMAYWMASHVGPAGAVVLAPPNETATLFYYGGLRGIASFGWDNRSGFQTAVRIASATTPEEAQELIGLHGVTHIVIPLWDPFMDAYAQIGEGQVEGTFLARLHQWNLPPWLKPIPYLLPSIGGFEGQSVVVLEVVDEQDDATAASRLVQYFIDMGQLDLATRAGVRLRRFPADLGALLARAQLEIATSENGEYADTLNLLVRRISSGADKALPWDQRVNLSIVLAQTRHVALARPRLKECFDEADEEELRTLSTNSLYRMLVLRKALNIDFSDPKMLKAAMDLLPADLRGRLGE